MTKKAAKEVAKAASSGDFQPIPEGQYVVKLRSCKVAEKEGPSGPYWKVEFEIPQGDHKGRRLWTNLSLSEAARFKVAEFFNAFGDPDCVSNTDDFVGHNCVAVVGTETQKAGANMGQLRNVIKALRPLDEEDEDEDDDDDDEDEDDDEDDI